MSEGGYYDIIIVGGGPAGANFARMIDSTHYSVLMVDGSLGKEKVCGGLISPDTQDILARYGMCLPSSVLANPQLFSVKTIDLKDGYTRYYRRSYINVIRQRFDGLLLSFVPDTVERTEGRCISVKKTDGGYSLQINVCGEKREYRCKYLVGADGGSSVVRRELFGDRGIYRYVAIQQWFLADSEDPFYSCVFDNETSSGCSWIFFKDGKMIFGGAFEPRKSREAFEKQKEKLAKLGIIERDLLDRPVRTEACQVVRPRLFSGVCLGKDGAFLLGEAAGLISPSSFEGISYALRSAELLADVLNEATKRKISPERAYKKATLTLRVKIAVKCLKRPFMYSYPLRRAVMKSGLLSLKKGPNSNI